MQNITTLNYFIPYASDIQKFRTLPTSSAGEAKRRQQLTCTPGGSAEQHKPSGRNLAIYRKIIHAIPCPVIYPKCTRTAIFIENSTTCSQADSLQHYLKLQKNQRSHVHNGCGSHHACSPWCHPTIWSSVVPFSSCSQSFPASGSFQMSQFFASGGQSTGVSASTSVLPMNTQDWSPLGWTGWISLQSKGLSRVFSNTTAQKHQFFSAQLSL